MKNTILTTIALFLICSLHAQPEKTLKTIAEKLVSNQDYSTHCICTFSFVNGRTMTFEENLLTQKNTKDTLCGFSYYFKLDEKYKGGSFIDFTIYFNGFYYSSYHGDITRTSIKESPEKFKGRHLSYGYVRPIYSSNMMYDFIPYQMGNTILTALKNEGTIISQGTDTTINLTICLFFELDIPNKYGGKDKYKLAFDKKELNLVFCKEEYGKDNSQFTQVSYSNTKINQNLSLSYFNEENLLGKNWKTNYTPPDKKKPNDLIGKQAPDWTLPVFGKEEKLSSDSLKGKYALVEFTATWCGYCIEAVKFMNRVEETFKENEKVEVVSIFSSHYDNKESISKFIERSNPTSTLLYLAKNVEKDYFVDGYPNFFIIDPDGQVLKSYPGYREALSEEIIKTLGDLAGEE